MWDMVLTILCLYIGIMLPFQYAFEQDFSSAATDVIIMTDRIVNIFFMLDVFLNFRTGFVSFDGEIVMDWKRIAKQYVRSWFFLDVLSSIPFDDLSSGEMIDLQAAKLLKFGKLARVIKAMRGATGFDLAEIS